MSCAAPPCPDCGAATERFWSKPANVIGDEYVTPIVDDAMAPYTQVFRTKSEHRAAMKRHGVRLMERGDMRQVLRQGR
jgi:hypothetical protein